MKKRKKGSSESNPLHQLRLGVIRKEKVAQGIFDGRFRTRSVASSKVYNRPKLKRISVTYDI